MDKTETIETIDYVVQDVNYIKSIIDIIGHESDYVYQARLNQFIIELDKIKTDLTKINDEIGD